ncbi:MAG: SLC13 family permease, partial [Bacteroidales bacterium]|nr:SLC13 family permease [Bacteroidales bacterium]
QKSDKELFDIDSYISEVEAVKSSKIVGKKISEVKKISGADVQILGLIRKNVRIHAPTMDELIHLDDIIIIESDADGLKVFIEDTGVELEGDEQLRINAEGSDSIMITEAVVMPDAPIMGKTASSIHMRDRYAVNLLAVARRDKKIKRRLDKVIFQGGDVLLLQGREGSIFNTISELGCLPLARRGLRIGYEVKTVLALSIFIVSILLVVTGLLPVEIAFSMAAVTMVLSGVIPVKHVYTAVDWPVIILLGAMIPVGAALETSGGAQIIASTILNAGQSQAPWIVLSALILITMLLSSVINNAAAVVLMAPIAISVAGGMGLASDPFLMTVAIGASAAFLTPIGHQSNTLVMGPGGYKFTDYMRLGFPMIIIMMLVGIPAILYFWPL